MWNKVVDFSSECADNDLQETFLKYPGSYISFPSVVPISSDDERSCVEWCRSVKDCHNVYYTISVNYCYTLSTKSVDVVESNWVSGDSSYNYYQKMCAWGSGQISGPSRHSMKTTTTRCSGCFGHLRWCSDCLTTSLLNCTRSAPIRVLF